MKIVSKFIKIILAVGITAGMVFIAAGMSEEIQSAARSVVTVVPSDSGIRLIRDGEQSDISEQADLIPGDKIVTSKGQTAMIRTGNDAIVRLSENSELKFVSEDGEGAGLLFELEKGRAWVNGIYTTSNINLIAGGAFLVSRMGSFDTDYDGSKTTVHVFVNQVTVGLVSPGVKFTKAVRFSSPSFINSFLMAQGRVRMFIWKRYVQMRRH